MRFITTNRQIICRPTTEALTRHGVYGWVNEYGSLIIWAAYVPLRQWEFVA